MNTIRMIAITLPMTFLLACGGGGGGGTTAVAPVAPVTPTPPTDDGGGGNVNPLDNFQTTSGSRSIRAFQGAIGASASMRFNIAEMSGVGTSGVCVPGISTCMITLTGDSGSLSLQHVNATDLSTIESDVGYLAQYNSRISSVATIDSVEFARGRLTATRSSDSALLEFQTFAGWLDDTAFGVVQVSIGETNNRQYNFLTYSVGDYNGASRISSIGSMRWEGKAVGLTRTDRTFIRGDATVTIDAFTNPTADLMIGNWRTADNQEISSVSAISGSGLAVARGVFELSSNGDQVNARFYGTGHEEVGGVFENAAIVGAFGAIRQ